MKKALFILAVICGLSLALVVTSCGGGGGSGSDDDATPVAESGFVAVSGATFDGTIAITGSSVFEAGQTVTIPCLWVCDHEVTQGEYEKYCSYGETTPSSTKGKGANYPVYYVNWYDALVYCNKRSIAEGLTPCYSISGKTNPSEWGEIPAARQNQFSTWNAIICDFTADGYRLPKIAEWEYLARGGNLTNSGQFTYSGSNTIGNVAWYKENAKALGSSSPDYGTHPVKTKAKNALNLYDMSGNVEELCWESYGAGASLNLYRYACGGSWTAPESHCKVTSSCSFDGEAYMRNYWRGFRVVCTRSE